MSDEAHIRQLERDLDACEDRADKEHQAHVKARRELIETKTQIEALQNANENLANRLLAQTQELHEAQAEAKKWKANHDNQVTMRRLISVRADLSLIDPERKKVFAQIVMLDDMAKEMTARAEKAEAELELLRKASGVISKSQARRLTEHVPEDKTADSIWDEATTGMINASLGYLRDSLHDAQVKGDLQREIVVRGMIASAATFVHALEVMAGINNG